MAIEGLKPVEAQATPNPSDEIGAVVEALDRLGRVQDHEQVTETVRKDFEALASLGIAGQKFVKLAKGAVSFGRIIEALDSGKYAGRQYPKTYVYEPIWKPDTVPGNLLAETQARLAVDNPDSTEEPLLHFLDRPFDDKYAEEGQDTQLDLIEKATTDFESDHEGFNMQALDHQDVAFIALMKRIKDETMPMEWGFMRDAALPRVSADDGSWARYVYSNDGGLYFDRSDGGADPDGGVGLSVGQKLEA